MKRSSFESHGVYIPYIFQWFPIPIIPPAFTLLHHWVCQGADSWRTELPMPRASPAKTPKPRPTSTTTWMPKTTFQQIWSNLTQINVEKHLKNSWKLPFGSLRSTPMCLDHLVLAIAICTSSSLAWLETASCGGTFSLHALAMFPALMICWVTSHRESWRH